MTTKKKAARAGTRSASDTAFDSRNDTGIDPLTAGRREGAMLEAALTYAGMGWRVFPLHSCINGQCSCGNAKEHGKGKHPRTANGVKDATSDATVIRQWWTQWPDANIGLACSDVTVVVDLDRKHGKDGIAELDKLMEQHGVLPETLVAETPTGGRHLVFRKPVGVVIKNRSDIRPGVDSRSDGGYIVAAPSTIDGNPYRWLNWKIDSRKKPVITDCPVWLLVILAEKTQRSSQKAAGTTTPSDPYAQRAFDSAVSRVMQATEGSRNTVLNTEAHGLARLAAANRIDWTTAENALLRAALSIGLTESEATATIRSAYTAGSQEPNLEGTRNDAGKGGQQAGNAPAGDSADDEKVSQASALVAFVEEHAELFHDQNGDVFAETKDTHETRRLDGRQFKDWLVSNFYKKTGKSPRDQSVREAISTLSGLGRYRGECRDVHIRVAKHGDDYYLDLAEPGKNRAVKISAGGWALMDNPPVRFIRPETIRPLPEPKRGGVLDVLWQIANIPKESRLLVLAWLCECLRTDTPFPVLELMGEQGSAKSTTQTALRRLIDPNACDLRSAPKTVEDVFVGAGASWLASYENISHLTAPMQDALCVLATGGGFAKRKLYSDADESVITVKRPVVLNGISVAVTAQDLVDRTLSIETPVINARVETTELWRNYDREHERLLGTLLDVMAQALALLPSIQIPAAERPRLAEFARFGMAVAKATGHNPEEFNKQFNACRQEAIARTLDASPVATAVVAWIERYPNGAEDTAGNLMNRMEDYKPQRVESWPWSAKGFADSLRRAAPALRQHGIECRSLPKTGGVIKWVIRKNSSNPSPECPDDPADAKKQDKQDVQDVNQENSTSTTTEIF